MNTKILFLVIAAYFSACCYLHAENGYELWLRYKPTDNTRLLHEYQEKNRYILFPANSPQLQAAKEELERGLQGMLQLSLNETEKVKDGTLIAGTLQTIAPYCQQALLTDSINQLTDEGYIIASRKMEQQEVIIIAGKTDKGTLYGIFHYLRLMQTQQNLDNLFIKENPKISYRVLNHWDNLNGSIERGYAGYSLWNWERLPMHKNDDRYKDYARANASVGINGVVLNNVNAEAKSLRREWLVKASGLADAFRPYGIRVYLTAKFSAPKEIGGLKTASPKDPQVREWWKKKVQEIYSIIPDFGGFLVKANSEGQPGPQDYGCSHADGANMQAEALEPFGGIVFWRAFVYQNERHVDRVITGYNEFKPLDGQFNRNVFVQPKNGPIDFQPREPFHPLFGSMPNTPLSMEVQITQENLGHTHHLVYLGTLFEEVLQSDTYANGQGSTVSNILQGYEKSHHISAIAGVPNIGSDINWTGQLFGQANWYAFGRLAWNPDEKSQDIANEWIRMTFSNEKEVIAPILKIMLMSRETYVNYTMPLGLNHIMNYGTHNGPEPWHDDPVWTAFDYHKVTRDSIGINRTKTGSGAVLQYHKPVCEQFNSLTNCPQEYLLWFHRLPWNYSMPSGRTLWNELVFHYYKGVDEVREMQQLWTQVEGKIDKERYRHVASLLKYQEEEAIWWRDACLLFFQEYSGQPIPQELEQPRHSLDYYKRIPFPYEWNGYYD